MTIPLYARTVLRAVKIMKFFRAWMSALFPVPVIYRVATADIERTDAVSEGLATFFKQETINSHLSPFRCMWP